MATLIVKGELGPALRNILISPSSLRPSPENSELKVTDDQLEIVCRDYHGNELGRLNRYTHMSCTVNYCDFYLW